MITPRALPINAVCAFQYVPRGTWLYLRSRSLLAAPYRTPIFLGTRDFGSGESLRHVHGTRVVAYSYAAAVTFLIYDIMLTFPDEVHFIWPNPMSITKLTFFFIRYFPPFLELSTQFYGAPLPLTYSPRACYIWNVYQGLSSILVVIAVDCILILRVFAMYPQSRPVRAISSLLFAAEIVTISPITFVIASGFPILYQTFLFAVTVVKFYKSVKEGWGHIPILSLLMRDGTWAFFLLFAILITEAMLYGINVGAYTGFLYGWVNTAFSICGYRILININKLGRHSGRHSSFDTSTEIMFTSHLELSHPTANVCEMAVLASGLESQQS